MKINHALYPQLILNRKYFDSSFKNYNIIIFDNRLVCNNGENVNDADYFTANVYKSSNKYIYVRVNNNDFYVTPDRYICGNNHFFDRLTFETFSEIPEKGYKETTFYRSINHSVNNLIIESRSTLQPTLRGVDANINGDYFYIKDSNLVNSNMSFACYMNNCNCYNSDIRRVDLIKDSNVYNSLFYNAVFINCNAINCRGSSYFSSDTLKFYNSYLENSSFSYTNVYNCVVNGGNLFGGCFDSEIYNLKNGNISTAINTIIDNSVINQLVGRNSENISLTNSVINAPVALRIFNKETLKNVVLNVEYLSDEELQELDERVNILSANTLYITKPLTKNINADKIINCVSHKIEKYYDYDTFENISLNSNGLIYNNDDEYSYAKAYYGITRAVNITNYDVRNFNYYESDINYMYFYNINVLKLNNFVPNEVYDSNVVDSNLFYGTYYDTNFYNCTLVNNNINIRYNFNFINCTYNNMEIYVNNKNLTNLNLNNMCLINPFYIENSNLENCCIISGYFLNLDLKNSNLSNVYLRAGNINMYDSVLINPNKDVRNFNCIRSDLCCDDLHKGIVKQSNVETRKNCVGVKFFDSTVKVRHMLNNLFFINSTVYIDGEKNNISIWNCYFDNCDVYYNNINITTNGFICTENVRFFGQGVETPTVWNSWKNEYIYTGYVSHGTIINLNNVKIYGLGLSDVILEDDCKAEVISTVNSITGGSCNLVYNVNFIKDATINEITNGGFDNKITVYNSVVNRSRVLFNLYDDVTVNFNCNYLKSAYVKGTKNISAYDIADNVIFIVSNKNLKNISLTSTVNLNNSIVDEGYFKIRSGEFRNSVLNNVSLDKSSIFNTYYYDTLIKNANISYYFLTNCIKSNVTIVDSIIDFKRTNIESHYISDIKLINVTIKNSKKEIYIDSSEGVYIYYDYYFHQQNDAEFGSFKSNNNNNVYYLKNKNILQ